MEVFIEKDNTTKNIRVDGEKKLKSILDELNISIESVILVKNGQVCLEDELICDKDKIKLLSVVSGG